MARSRESKHELLCKAGETIAAKLDLPLESVRHVSCVKHNGRQWTVEDRWDRFSDGIWTPIDLDDWFAHH